MEALARLIFDEPFRLYVVLAAAEVVLVAVWYSRRSPRWAVSLLAAPVLAGAVALVDWLVVTERERIVDVLSVAAGHLEAGDVRAAGECLDRDCRAVVVKGVGFDKPGIISKGREALARWPMRRVKLRKMDIKIEGARAAADVDTQMESTRGEARSVGWRLELIKRQTGWRIIRLEITHPAWLTDWNFGGLPI